VVIYRAPGVVIREIKLRRGLNIVWSRDQLSAASRAGTPAGLGHSAGKTLFCRLLRYALGEESFGDEDLQREVRLLVPSGWVGADVEVAGVHWTVLRSLRSRKAVRARQGGTLGDLFSEPDDEETYGAFLSAVEHSLPRLPEEVEAGVGGLRWPASLAWLSRDQERHFRELRDWRTRWTPARVEPTLTWLSNFMRASLQLRADDEEIAFRAKAGRLRERQDVRRKVNSLRDLETLARSIGMFKNRDDGPLFYEASQSIAQGVETSPPMFDVSEVIAASVSLEATRSKLSELERRVTEARQLRDDAQRDFSHFQAARAALVDRIARETKCPNCGYQWNRLEVEAGPVFLPGMRPVRPEDEMHELEEIKKSAVRRLNQANEEIVALDATRVEMASELQRCVRKCDDANKRFALLSKDVVVRQRSRAVDESDQQRFLELIRQGSSLQDQSKEINKSITSLKDELEAARNRQWKALVRVDMLFGAVIRELFDENATGAVRLKKQSLECDVYLDGRRRSTAIDALNVVAFDVAVMALAGAGHAALPAWLVHDSPRTADLSLINYHRLFEMIVKMERATAGDPWFQYIITTTTPPPTKFQNDEYVKLELNGAGGAGRLLRTSEAGEAA